MLPRSLSPACLVAALWYWGGTTNAQVVIDAPLRFTGPQAERRIDGLAEPMDSDDLVTVGFSVEGAAHWCTATMDGDTVRLWGQPLQASLKDGTMIRFPAPATVWGELYIAVPNGTVLPLLRPDGLGPVHGQVVAGALCEVVHYAEQFTLTAPHRHGCPPGTFAIGGPGCIDSTLVPDLLFHEAAELCAAKGGRLCSWQEFHMGCVLSDEGLDGLFAQWEWVDDTSNHAHTVVQVGRTTCVSQRGVNPSVTAATRCCYQLP